MQDRELLRQKIEKLLWKHYEPDQAMNGEEASEEFLKLFDERDEELVKKIEGMKERLKHIGAGVDDWAYNGDDIINAKTEVADDIIKLIKG